MGKQEQSCASCTVIVRLIPLVSSVFVKFARSLKQSEAILNLIGPMKTVGPVNQMNLVNSVNTYKCIRSIRCLLDQVNIINDVY